MASGPPGGRKLLWVDPNDTANASVMRLENSADISRCLKEGSSPVLKLETVGSDSSSLTPGSSIPSVAGKKRLPTISWATPPPRGTSASASPGRPVRKRRVDIKILRKLRRERIERGPWPPSSRQRRGGAGPGGGARPGAQQVPGAGGAKDPPPLRIGGRERGLGGVCPRRAIPEVAHVAAD